MGWIPIEDEDMNFARESLKIMLPKSVKELKYLVPDLDPSISESVKLEYEWTINKVKDS